MNIYSRHNKQTTFSKSIGRLRLTTQIIKTVCVYGRFRLIMLGKDLGKGLSISEIVEPGHKFMVHFTFR